MKHIFTIILTIFALCVSYKGKGAASASNANKPDSINELSAGNPFAFLEKLGIDYESLIAKDDSLPAPSDKDLLLTTKEQGALLKGVIDADFDISDTTSVYFISVRQINDDVVLCQYKYLYSDMEDVYIATYDADGAFIDAMYAGSYWDKSDLADNPSDSTELISTEHTLIYFIADHEFTYTYDYKEIEHNINSDKDTTTYLQTNSMCCNIEQNGKIAMTSPEVETYEEGMFRLWIGSGSKDEWEKTAKIQTLARYPYSDETVLEKWDSLGNEVDAAVAESFVFHFFNYVFMPQPEKVLRYVYENRDNKSLSLTMPLGSYYTYSPQTRKVIDTAIAKLDSPAMRKYYKEMTELWVSYANN